jgi:DNA-binding NarL/FixJ family response regulator
MPPAESLTSRERDVLGLVGRGLSNTEICQQLHISMATTKTHIGRLLTKLGARDRAQLVIAAYQSGLVSSPHGGLSERKPASQVG